MKKILLTFFTLILGWLYISAQEYCIIGPAVTGGWIYEDLGKNQLSGPTDGKYSITVNLTSGDFRINQKGGWWPAYVPKDDNNVTVAKEGGTYEAKLATGETTPFHMAEGGKYNVVLNLSDTNNPKMEVTRIGEAEPSLWLVGNATLAGWDTGKSKQYKMNANGLEYSYFGPLFGTGSERFVFLANEGEWWPRYTNNENNNRLILSPGSAYDGLTKLSSNDTPAFGVETSGVYWIYVTLNEDLQGGTVRIEEATLSLVGPAAGGWDTGINVNWTKTEDGKYTYTGDFQTGEFRINKQGDWWPCFTTTSNENQNITSEGGDFDLMWGTGDGPKSFNITTAGRYTLTLDVANMKLNVKAEDGDGPVVTPPDLWLIGAATPGDWDPNNSKNQKMDRDGNTYTWIGPLTQFGDRGRFVFTATEGDYQPRFVPASKENPQTIKVGEPCNIVKESSDSPAFYVDVPAVYKVTITLNDDMESGVLNLEYAPICLSGPAVSGKWESADLAKNELSFDGNGKYTWSGEVGLEAQDQYTGGFRINQSGKWNPSFWPVGEAQIPAEGGSYEAKWVNGDQTDRFQFTAAGKYTVTLDLTTDDGNTSPKVVVTPYEEKPLTELYIVGNALNGIPGNWDLNDEYVKPMALTENPGEFIWEGPLYKDGEFKFLYSNDSWDGLKADASSNVTIESGQSYGLTEANDYKFVVPEDDIYTVVAKTYGDNKSVTITGLGIGTSVETIGANSAIYVNGRQLTVEGTANVYDFAGRTVASFSNGTRTLPAAGLYIVVCNGKASRILVK